MYTCIYMYTHTYIQYPRGAAEVGGVRARRRAGAVYPIEQIGL